MSGDVFERYRELATKLCEPERPKGRRACGRCGHHFIAGVHICSDYYDALPGEPHVWVARERLR
jgi:hypothetical protein